MWMGWDISKVLPSPAAKTGHSTRFVVPFFVDISRVTAPYIPNKLIARNGIAMGSWQSSAKRVAKLFVRSKCRLPFFLHAMMPGKTRSRHRASVLRPCL